MELNKHILSNIKASAIKHVSVEGTEDEDIIAEESLLKSDLSSLPKNKPNLYIENEPLKPGQVIHAGEDEIHIEKETIMVFSDDEPLLNWSHDCRYLLFDAYTEKMYSEIPAHFPPRLVDPPESFISFHQQTMFLVPMENVDITIKPREKVEPRFPHFKSDRYALLFSGASNNRHVNDLEHLYRILTNVYDFNPGNIYVLNYNGTTDFSDFHKPIGIIPHSSDPFFQMMVNGAGTRSEVENVIDELKGRIKEEDLLFIHTTNHGSGPKPELNSAKRRYTESSFNTYTPKGELHFYFAEDFAGKLADLPKFGQLYVMMEQCHSGGFGKHILKYSPAYETCFVSACEEDKKSRGGWDRNPFTLAWSLAVDGRTYIPAEEDVPAPAVEAFEKAKRFSDRDTPVIMDNPAGCSNRMILGSNKKI